MIFTVDILPLIIGTAFNMGLGALWYSNVLFAKQWMKESGVTDDQVSDTTGMGKVYALTMLMALTTAYVIGFLINNLALTSIIHVLVLAVVVWMGIDLPMIIKNWGFEGRTIKLGLINHTYQLAIYVVVGILFAIL